VLDKPDDNWFRKNSRVQQYHEPEVWKERLERAGFEMIRYWHYFSPASMRVLEWGHYFGLPALIAKTLTGKWILSPTKWNLSLTKNYVEKYASPEPLNDGTFTFYIARKR